MFLLKKKFLLQVFIYKETNYQITYMRSGRKERMQGLSVFECVSQVKLQFDSKLPYEV